MELMGESLEICPLCGYDQRSGVQEGYYLEPGTVLQGQYLLGKVLGYGGFGITYIGYDNSLQRKVAVKEYLPSDYATRGPGIKEPIIYPGDAEEQFQAGLSSFLEEARKLAGFSGIPEIVGIYDFFQENGTGYIVMEYLKGETVKELLSEKGKLPYQKAEEIILHVLEGLEAVHKEGIIHRDIAPDNIFITDKGEIRLLDFGAARSAVSTHTKSLSVILKPGYAPEEQYRSHGEQGPWTDIYGVGATFYRMITGNRPPEALERMEKDELKAPSELGIKIPAEKEALLLKSLEVRMENRIQSAEEFREALLLAGPEHKGEEVPPKNTPKEKEREKEKRSDREGKGGTSKKILAICLVMGVGLAGIYAGISSGGNKDQGTESFGKTGQEHPSEPEDSNTAELIRRRKDEEKAEEERRRLQSEADSTAYSEAESAAESERKKRESESAAESERKQSEEESAAQSEEESAAESERLQSEAESMAQSEEESSAESERLQSEAELTAQSEKESEAEARRPSYQIVLTIGEEERKIAMTDETGIKADTMIIKEADDTVIYSRENPTQEKIIEIGAEEGKRYHIQLSNAETGENLVYYNLPLSDMKILRLREEEGYAYSIYRTADTNERISTEQYAVKTYEEEQTRYLISSGLAVRSIPNNEGNDSLYSLGLGAEITVCGLAKGQIDGEERDWYLIRTDDEGYAYISAGDSYTSANKEDVPAAETTPPSVQTDTFDQTYIPPNNYTPPAPKPSPTPTPKPSPDPEPMPDIDWEEGGIKWN